MSPCPTSNEFFVSAANKTTSKSNCITTNNKGAGRSYGLGQINSGTPDNKINCLHGPKCETWRWWYRSWMWGLFLPLADSPHKHHSRLSANVMALHQHARDDHGVDDVLPRWKSSTPHAMSQPFPKKSIYSLHCSYALLLAFTTDHLIPILSRYVHHTHHLLPTMTIPIHKCPQPLHVGLPRRFWRVISWMQVANSFITYILSN